MRGSNDARAERRAKKKSKKGRPRKNGPISALRGSNDARAEKLKGKGPIEKRVKKKYLEELLDLFEALVIDILRH